MIRNYWSSSLLPGLLHRGSQRRHKDTQRVSLWFSVFPLCNFVVQPVPPEGRLRLTDSDNYT